MASTDTQAATPTIPFEIASTYSTRHSFDVDPKTLAVGTPTQATPVQIPAVGYLAGIWLHFKGTTEGNPPSANAHPDAPWNIISNISFRNAAGADLISAVNGYDLYLMNKYGGQLGPYSDPGNWVNFQPTAQANAYNFALYLPICFDLTEASGLLPALRSSENYQLEIQFAPVGTVFPGATAGTIACNAIAEYYDIPATTSPQNIPQATQPYGLPSFVLWRKESLPLTAGDKTVQSTNTGNILRTHILVFRDADGKRVQYPPPNIDLLMDNVLVYHMPLNYWAQRVQRAYGFDANYKANPTVTGGPYLDPGVHAIPYFALTSGLAGDPSNTRAQLKPTIGATQVQFKIDGVQADVATLQILTQAISTNNTDAVFVK
jgi:hypothetical protein